VVAFVKETADPGAMAADVRQMEAQVPALGLYGLLVAAGDPRGAVPRLAPAMATLTAVNEHERFLAAAMAFCNELASRWRCERVGVGFLKARYVELLAMSHTEKFSRKMQAVQLIEAAMEECLDQDVEIAFPAGDEADFVSRDARELSAQGGPTAVLSLPLRKAGRVAAVVTMERALDSPFDDEEVESLRLTCELCAPRLADLRGRDRWIGAKAADGLRGGLAALVGPRYTWMKLLAVLLVAGGLYVGLATGEYRIEAPFVLEAARRQVLPAPFDGEIEAVHVEVGDEVQQGQVLARLKTVALERQANAARAELFEYRKQADSARAEKKWAEAQMAAAKGSQLTEKIQLLTERIEKASIRSLIAGTVVSGDLERFVGASVEKGQVLFEVAPIRSLRAELSVPEDQIADLLAARREGEVRGTLAAVSYPDEKIGFVVDRIHPMAEEADDQAVFKVRAALGSARNWMRPGMEGVAHVSLGRRRLAWLWSRRLVNRLRLWLWL
ncbi:MAG: HlyD family efflux transporter periplasmic adaptor subunit, partial [Phycisphaerae bacterium]